MADDKRHSKVSEKHFLPVKMKLAAIDDYSSLRYENLRHEVSIFNKGTEVRCAGIFLVRRSAVLKTTIKENTEIHIDNDSLDDILTLLYGGEIKENNDKLYDLIKFGIEFEIEDLYLEVFRYIRDILCTDTFQMLLTLCKKANKIAKDHGINLNFYSYHYQFVYKIDVTKIDEVLLELLPDTEQFSEFLLSSEIFPIVVKLLPNLIARWKSDNILLYLQQICDIDFSYIDPRSVTALFKEIRKSNTVDNVIVQKIQEMQLKVTTLMLESALLQSNGKPQVTLMQTKPWKEFNHFYEVLALEYLFPGLDFIKMVQIYIDWGMTKDDTEKQMVCSRLALTEKDAYEALTLESSDLNQPSAFVITPFPKGRPNPYINVTDIEAHCLFISEETNQSISLQTDFGIVNFCEDDNGNIKVQRTNLQHKVMHDDHFLLLHQHEIKNYLEIGCRRYYLRCLPVFTLSDIKTHARSGSVNKIRMYSVQATSTENFVPHPPTVTANFLNSTTTPFLSSWHAR